MKRQHRRWYAFISNEPVQRFYMRMHFFGLLAIMICVLVVSYSLFTNFLNQVTGTSLGPEALRGLLQEMFVSLVISIILIFAVGYVLTLLLALSFLHRVTGPLKRVREILNHLAEGKFPEGIIKFRKGDYSKDIALALSRLLDYLNRNRTPLAGVKSGPQNQSRPNS